MQMSIANFTVLAIPFNGGPYNYQWRRNSLPLADGPTGSGSIVSGAATALLSISNTSAADVATYDCVVTTPGCGSVFSSVATLTVYAGGSGDGNLSGQTNGLDIQGFVDILLGGGSPSLSYCAYDVNGDGAVDLADLPGFLALLLA